ncbi:CHASE3 domain-containing protein [Rhodanobacter lindaniclasticus]
MNFRSFMTWRIAGLLLAMLIIVGLPYLVTRLNTRDTVLANNWVAHSTEVRSLAYRIAYLMRSSEAMTYRLVVGNLGKATQADAEGAAQQVPHLLQQLRTMTRDNPAQQTLIGALENSVTGRLTLMARARELRRQGDVARAGKGPERGGRAVPVRGQDRWHRGQRGSAAGGTPAGSRQAGVNGQLVQGITALAQLLLLAIIVVASERQIRQRRGPRCAKAARCCGRG